MIRRITHIGLAVAGIALIIAVMYALWSAERWVNWKFSYGQMVETRIEILEAAK